MTGERTEGEVVVLVAWHLRRTRDMPRAFLEVRRLDRSARGQPGARWIHRWISRRSVALTTRWESIEAAEAWLATPDFRTADTSLRALPGVETRVERYRDL